jgi:host cell factor
LRKEKNSDDPSWFDVALTQSTRHEIKSYFVEADKDDSGLASDEVLFLDSDKHWKKQTLGSGITYRVRICAINACGRSIFSDHSAYKTIVPGFPRAPTSIKVSKTDDGASLSWSPPVNTEIIEYSVYLAVKQHQTSGKTNNFIRVYLGDQPNCIVSHSSLAQAATNTESSNKPAVIFRIAAKNKKGYGPATQVRWLQDSRVKRQAQNIKNEAAKKAKQSL